MDLLAQKDVMTWKGVLEGDPLVREILTGLTSEQKFLNPKLFYNQRGSELFDLITQLPEYYPTRTEIKILQQYAPIIAKRLGQRVVIIEPGAGNCEKVRHLLNEARPAAYVPQDISAEFLQLTADQLRKENPWLRVCPVVGDFASGVSIPEDLPNGRRIAFYPGSTIGNFEPDAAADFMRTLGQMLGNQGGMIIGVDLQKEPALLNAAYNDSKGVTAEFNRNILNHVNQIVGADIDPEAFSHRAYYNERYNRVEMHLVCEQPQRVLCEGIQVSFERGETIHTESSYKYTQESFAALAASAGYQVIESWTDERKLFSVNYLEVAE